MPGKLCRVDQGLLARLQRNEPKRTGARVKFLSEVLNTDKFPLTVLDRPMESETCKIVENSYRATILAFLDEWSVFAEKNGVDLTKVVDAIKVRPTHFEHDLSRTRYRRLLPAQGRGLGCLGLSNLMGFEDDIFKNHDRPPSTSTTPGPCAPHEITRDALRNMGKIVATSTVAVVGRLLSGRCRRHPLQRIGNHRPENNRNGRRNHRA